MNRTRSIMLAASLGLSLAAIPVLAQGAPPAGPHTGAPAGAPAGKWMQGRRPHMSMEQRFTKMLNLTPAQQLKIAPLLKKSHEQMRAIRKNPKLTPDQKRQQSKALFSTLPKKLNHYLTKPQQAKLQQMVERRGHHHMGAPGMAPKPKA